MPADSPLQTLTQALARACRQLADAGRPEEAGRLAAVGWVALREDHPKQAGHLDGVMHYVARLDGVATPDQSQTSQRKERAVPHGDRLLDVRTETPARRHEIIIEACLALEPDTGCVLVNDHDPKPLYYQLAAEHPDEFLWRYLDEGPEVWTVRIARTPDSAREGA